MDQTAVAFVEAQRPWRVSRRGPGRFGRIAVVSLWLHLTLLALLLVTVRYTHEPETSPLPSTVSMVFDGGSPEGAGAAGRKGEHGAVVDGHAGAGGSAAGAATTRSSSTARGYSAACATDRSRAAAATLARGANPTGAITAAAHTTACGIR